MQLQVTVTLYLAKYLKFDRGTIKLCNSCPVHIMALYCTKLTIIIMYMYCTKYVERQFVKLSH